MKKILFYTDTPLRGGAENHMLELAKHLDKSRFEVSLACSNYPQLDEWCAAFEGFGVKVHRLRVKHKHDPRHFFALRKIFASDKPDILHLHLWNPASCRYAFKAADPSIKIVATEHDPFALKGLKQNFKKSCLEKTAQTITVSKANEDLMLKLYPELEDGTLRTSEKLTSLRSVNGRITTIHNGINLKELGGKLLHFSPRDRQLLRHELFHANAEDFVITTVATLHPRKGLRYLIEAFSEFKKEYPQSRLVLVGEGPQKKEIEKFIKKLGLVHEVVVLGYQEKVLEIMKSSDLFVLPSIKEAFGLVLLEAMVAQVPIVATRVGGIPEIIEDGKTGLLVEPGNAEALNIALKKLRKNPPLREKFVFLGRHHVQEFTIEKMAKKTEAVYDQVLTS